MQHSQPASSSRQGPSQQPSSSQPAGFTSSGVTRGVTNKGKLLLLDDLPYVGDSERRQRLMSSLRDMCLTSRCPVVLVVTEASGGSGGRGGGGGEGGMGAMGAMGGYSKGLHKVRAWAILAVPMMAYEYVSGHLRACQPGPCNGSPLLVDWIVTWHFLYTPTQLPMPSHALHCKSSYETKSDASPHSRMFWRS